MKVLEVKSCDECPCYSDCDCCSPCCGLSSEVNYEDFYKYVSEDCHYNCPLRKDPLCFMIALKAVPDLSLGGAIAESFEEEQV